jgi:hypothetical protein
VGVDELRFGGRVGGEAREQAEGPQQHLHTVANKPGLLRAARFRPAARLKAQSSFKGHRSLRCPLVLSHVPEGHAMPELRAGGCGAAFSARTRCPSSPPGSREREAQGTHGNQVCVSASALVKNNLHVVS